mmetsp:Transcript_16091/g.17747  ORF Transcript_16091/g.17747 Transcript_16091/m.17747 type:complete len:297 (-) Transcript_16091:77-967(-)|eukprot:CAMPEP_0170770072 /NCGR_PEP_ID=MMETSP0733-20121128/7316_1 /TAXON_ID=186038 /ORGANISM="Fragilariopsis kerguelensis, Strain L26-C5" /LENGTH=296 /DNA_ID=CAMNT_0011111711 /DNA_START=25 /DNA_END=915 /DNA_ORIENTATION=+
MIALMDIVSQTLPPLIPGIGGALITTFQTLGTIMSFQNEVNPSTRTQYSKFAATAASSSTDTIIKGTKEEETKKKKKQLVSSETGMTIIYAPAFFVSTFILLGDSSLVAFLPNPTLACVLCTIHFAKRVCEVKFLHKYSGTVELAVSSFIGTYYALISILICSVATPTPSATSVWIGTSLFSIGVVGNLYHHYLLANLRSSNSGGNSGTTTDSSSSKRYITPKGGLFEFVAAPHYLFELIGWLGLAIVAEHVNAFLVFTSMSSYLAGRAVSQNRWNREKFQDEWSNDKKNLIPFLF